MLDAAKSNTIEGFSQHGGRRSQKNCVAVAGFTRSFRFNTLTGTTTEAGLSADNLFELLNLIPLLVDKQFRVTDDVDE